MRDNENECTERLGCTRKQLRPVTGYNALFAAVAMIPRNLQHLQQQIHQLRTMATSMRKQENIETVEMILI